MHRRRGRRQAQVQGLTWPLRNRLLEAAGGRLIDVRDRALLAVGYDTLLRRAELVSLEVTDLLEDIDGTATLLVRSGKTDPDGRGAMLYLARDSVQMVKAWLNRSGVDAGRLFRSVRKDGTVGEKLDGSQVPRIYKRMARRAGLPDDVADTLAGHSTRVGAVQDMIACGIELPAILQSGRWKRRAHGAALRGAAAGAAERRRTVGRAAAALRRTACAGGIGAVTPRAAAAGCGGAPAVRGHVTDARRAVIASKNVSAPHSDPRRPRIVVTQGGVAPTEQLKRCQQVAAEAAGLRITFGKCRIVAVLLWGMELYSR